MTLLYRCCIVRMVEVGLSRCGSEVQSSSWSAESDIKHKYCMIRYAVKYAST